MSDDVVPAMNFVKLLDRRGDAIAQSFESLMEKYGVPADERSSLARSLLMAARECTMEYTAPSICTPALVDPDVFTEATKYPTLHLQVSLTCDIPPMSEFNWIRSGIWWYVTIPSSQLDRLIKQPTVEKVMLERPL